MFAMLMVKQHFNTITLATKVPTVNGNHTTMLHVQSDYSIAKNQTMNDDKKPPFHQKSKRTRGATINDEMDKCVAPEKSTDAKISSNSSSQTSYPSRSSSPLNNGTKACAKEKSKNSVIIIDDTCLLPLLRS